MKEEQVEFIKQLYLSVCALRINEGRFTKEQAQDILQDCEIVDDVWEEALIGYSD